MNSLSVIAVADFLGIDRKYTIAGLARCSSAHRRFEHKGVTENGVKIVDDYAHHPTEIAATLAAAKNTPHNELWCIFQPHTYSRTKALLDEFGQALATCDHVLLADIYAANGGHAIYLGDFDSITEYVKKNCKKNDLLITMGAGNVDSI